ncbi:MAG: aldehyde dehydrogenase family protein [Geminicoccaceae bacterium]
MPTEPAEAYAALRSADRDGGLPPERREALLDRLRRMVTDRRRDLVAALQADFGRRAAEEILVAEVLTVVRAAQYARRHLRRWAKPRRVGVPWPFLPARAWIVPQPLGVVGIVSPWNYPVHLSLVPVVDALAAGNRVALKPSELTPRTANALEVLLRDALGDEVARTVLGGPETAAEFVRQPFDHLMFTGSTARGREVLQASAENLTPVTLELGGKCPAILLPDADLDRAVAAILRGKGLNAGQTCIAADLLLTVGHDRTRVVDALRRAHGRLFPVGLPTDLHPARQYGLSDVVGDTRLEPLGVEPCVSLATDLTSDSPLLREEIFGPVLPLIELSDAAAASSWVRSRPAPLALYLFTRSTAAVSGFLAATRSGAVVVNETVVHAAMTPLPFGGLGASGFGRYHGEAGFRRFSNERLLVRGARRSLAAMLAPPYRPRSSRLIDRLFRM